MKPLAFDRHMSTAVLAFGLVLSLTVVFWLGASTEQWTGVVKNTILGVLLCILVVFGIRTILDETEGLTAFFAQWFGEDNTDVDVASFVTGFLLMVTTGTALFFEHPMTALTHILTYSILLSSIVLFSLWWFRHSVATCLVVRLSNRKPQQGEVFVMPWMRVSDAPNLFVFPQNEMGKRLWRRQPMFDDSNPDVLFHLLLHDLLSRCKSGVQSTFIEVTVPRFTFQTPKVTFPHLDITLKGRGLDRFLAILKDRLEQANLPTVFRHKAHQSFFLTVSVDDKRPLKISGHQHMQIQRTTKQIFKFQQSEKTT